jgi:hypothetical protein
MERRRLTTRSTIFQPRDLGMTAELHIFSKTKKEKKQE